MQVGREFRFVPPDRVWSFEEHALLGCAGQPNHYVPDFTMASVIRSVRQYLVVSTP